MKSFWTLAIGVLLAAGPAAQSPADMDDAARYWPQWRGPAATGVSPDGNPPVHWSESQNVRWKIEVPGRGKGTPVIWGDRIFLTTAITTDERGYIFRGLLSRLMGGYAPSRVQQFVIMAISRANGSILWRRIAHEGVPPTGTHADGTWASHSVVTDGEHVCAFFGSSGLYCYDMNGTLQWETDLGDMSPRMGFGEGASPVLHVDRIIVPWDHERQSFIAAFDKRTGEELWRTDRDEITSWTTPIVVEHGGHTQVVTSATNRVRAYDFDTGALIWDSDGVTLNAIPSPVAEDGFVYVTSGFQGSDLKAIDVSRARGDITDTDAIVWQHTRDTPYVSSPLLYDGTLYFLKSNSGILSTFDARTGQRLYDLQRLRAVRSVYASPVAAQDRVYITGRNGTTLVLRHGSMFEVIATNTLDDEFDASAAIVDGELYLRGQRFLYCIAQG